MNKVDLHHVEWVKSSYSHGNGECVEVAVLDDTVATRDSKQQSGPVVTTTREGWRAFLDGVVKGEVGRP
ncbi:DUF397 domain-containing protein [Streptomyces sp. WZ-12]|uniref:DUF397 domain-containing protein n=1 Tax=Streptomyces sp. WZ-12 TaxID=3030210 RepID=UPI002380E1CE|nr:DUF397 domain-containing protein [Streptomyces sp. WZ-12]